MPNITMNLKPIINKLSESIKRSICFIAAILFLLEAWLWDHLYPIVAKLVAWLPWENIKRWIAERIQHLPASVCVFIFIIPALAILPLKLLGVWLVSQHYFFSGIIVFLGAKLVGLGITAFLFETCKEKLLSLGWCLWLYNTMLRTKEWAKRQVTPAIAEIRALKAKILGEKSEFITLLKKLRQNALYRRKK